MFTREKGQGTRRPRPALALGDVMMVGRPWIGLLATRARATLAYSPHLIKDQDEAESAMLQYCSGSLKSDTQPITVFF